MKARYNKKLYCTTWAAANMLGWTHMYLRLKTRLAEHGIKPASAYLKGTTPHPLWSIKDIEALISTLSEPVPQGDPVTLADQAEVLTPKPPVEPLPSPDATPLVLRRLEAMNAELNRTLKQLSEGQSVLAQALDMLTTVQNQSTTLLQAMLDEMTRPGTMGNKANSNATVHTN